MEKRAFTGQLLSRLGVATAAEPRPLRTQARPRPISAFPGRVLVVADLPYGQALPVLQEAWALQRFDCRVEAMVQGAALPALARYAPAGTLFPADQPVSDTVLEGAQALLAIPSQTLLARLALGLQDRPAAWETLQALWRGVPVYMDFSCALAQRGLACNSPGLAALYASYLAQVRAFGVIDVAPGTYLRILQKENVSPPSLLPAAASSGKGRTVITREDVLAYQPQASQWMLPRDALITALAKDEAKKRGLALLRQQERAPAGKDA